MAGLEILGALASLASGVVSAMGAMQSAEAQARANEYNAKVQDRNAIIADQNRQHAIQTADVAAQDKRRENRRVLASVRAAYGTSGLEMAGSPLDVLEDTALEQELSASRVKYEGTVRAREGAIQMLGYNEDATLQRMEAQSARAAGGVAAAGALLGGVGNALTRMG